MRWDCADTTRTAEAVAPVSPSVSPPLGSVEGLSPNPVEHGPGSQPRSPGPAVSPGPADLDPEAVRGALQGFVEELRAAQRERVRGEGLRRGPRPGPHVGLPARAGSPPRPTRAAGRASHPDERPETAAG